MLNLGTVIPGTTIEIPFDTFAVVTGAPTALSNFAVGDILVYKDSSTTARASTTGYTATTTFSSITGINDILIDLSSDATADFYKAGSRYFVVVSPVTADGQTMSFVVATFRIGYPNAILNTAVATLSSQTSFFLGAGPGEDDALNGLWAIVHDKASAIQFAWVQILDYVGSTKEVTLVAAPTFTIAAIDNFSVFGPMPLQPTVLGTRLDVTATGAAGVDWGNVENKTTANALTATSIITTQQVDVNTIKTNAVVNGGTVTFPTNATLASTTNITAGTITTTTNLTNAATAGDFTATMKTSIGTAVAGSAVASVTGNVGGNVNGNVVGSIGSLATQAKADVNAEVNDVINVDTKAELSGVPAANASIGDKLTFIEMKIRNEETSDGTEQTISNDAGAVIATAPLSDLAGTFTKGEYA